MRRLLGAYGYGSDRIHGPNAVTATESSKWAERLRSRVTAVQPSARTSTSARPTFTMGSMARHMPGTSRSRRPGGP